MSVTCWTEKGQGILKALPFLSPSRAIPCIFSFSCVFPGTLIMHFYFLAFRRGILCQLLGVCRWFLRARETLSNCNVQSSTVVRPHLLCSKLQPHNSQTLHIIMGITPGV